MWWLFACTADPYPRAEPFTPDPFTPGPFTPDPIETVVGPGDPDPVEIPAEIPIFDPNVMHRVDLELSASAHEALSTGDRSWTPANLVIDGVTLGTVGVRLKGNSTLRYLPDKVALKVDLNRYIAQRYDGLERFDLHNMLWDETQLHEVLATHVLAALGTPTRRASFAWVNLDGEDFGLYALAETYDDRWLDRTRGDAGLRLYEGGFPSDPAEDAADFSVRLAPNFELEHGEDVANADVLAVARSSSSGAGTWAERVAPMLDLSTFARLYVAEAWIGHWDGYVTGANNFYVVSRGPSGPVEVLPAGLDGAFTEGRRWDQPLGELAVACREDPDCQAELSLALDQAITRAEANDLLEIHDSLRELVVPFIEADPRREVRDEAWPAAQDGLRTWIETRNQTLAADLALTPED